MGFLKTLFVKPPGKLPDNFAADYIRLLRSLSKKHRDDDATEVKKALGALSHMSRESRAAGRGDVWIPRPLRGGHYPVIDDIPYPMVKRALRKNTGERLRQSAWKHVEKSTRKFVPLFAHEPGSLNRLQRKRLMSHAMVSLPITKGRTPALLGKKVPGQLNIGEVGGSRSVVPIRGIDPGEWAKGGFTMRKFALVDEETRYYALGYAARLGGIRKALRWLQREILPATVVGGTLGVLSGLHTETGMFPATTVAGTPVAMRTLGSEFAGIPNTDLRSLQDRLQVAAMRMTDPNVRGAILKKVGSITMELQARNII